MKTRFFVVVLLSLAVCRSAGARLDVQVYLSIACRDLWPAVEETLSVPENYIVKTIDDSKMKASYNVKHQIHVTITETVLQRTKEVTIVP